MSLRTTSQGMRCSHKRTPIREKGARKARSTCILLCSSCYLVTVLMLREPESVVEWFLQGACTYAETASMQLSIFLFLGIKADMRIAVQVRDTHGGTV